MSPELWNRIPPEAQVIFLEMAETIKRLEARIEELERRLNLTPQNSSLPPSSQHPHAKPTPPKPKSNKKRGGQKGHHKHQRTLVPPEDVNETVTLKPPHCRRRGEPRRNGDEADRYRRRGQADRHTLDGCHATIVPALAALSGRYDWARDVSAEHKIGDAPRVGVVGGRHALPARRDRRDVRASV
jgi:hypothetical protein